MQINKQFASILIACLCWGCGQNPEGIETITSDKQYRDVLAQTQKLSEKPLQEFQNNGSVSESSKPDLIESLKHFKSLTAYSPDKYALFLGEAKVHRALDDNKAAVQALNDAMSHAPKNLVNAPDKQTVAEILGEMAAISLENNEVDTAEGYVQKAISLNPQNVDYMAAAAGIRLQKKDISGAKMIIDEGLKLDPNHRKLAQLKKLIESENTEPHVEKK